MPLKQTLQIELLPHQPLDVVLRLHGEARGAPRLCDLLDARAHLPPGLAQPHELHAVVMDMPRLHDGRAEASGNADDDPLVSEHAPLRLPASRARSAS